MVSFWTALLAPLVALFQKPPPGGKSKAHHCPELDPYLSQFTLGNDHHSNESHPSSVYNLMTCTEHCHALRIFTTIPWRRSCKHDRQMRVNTGDRDASRHQTFLKISGDSSVQPRTRTPVLDTTLLLLNVIWSFLSPIRNSYSPLSQFDWHPWEIEIGVRLKVVVQMDLFPLSLSLLFFLLFCPPFPFSLPPGMMTQDFLIGFPWGTACSAGSVTSGRQDFCSPLEEPK